MKRKIFSVLIALVLVLSFGLVATPAAVSANGTTFAGSTIEVTSLTEPYATQNATAFAAEPHTTVVDDAAFDAQTSPVIIEGAVSGLDLGAGWLDTAYLEIGLRPEATDDRNAGVYLIAFNLPGEGGTRIHLQDYTGSGQVGGLIDLSSKDIGFRYKITLEPSGDIGGTATLEVWVGESLEGTATLPYGYASSWEEGVAGALDEDFSEAHLFYSIIAECRGAADQPYSAIVGDITIDDTLYVGPEQQFTTIQDAINAAVPGHTISVEAGIYNENVAIDKTLTLEGANAGVPATEERGPESIIDAQLAEFAVLINGAETVATFDGFTVENYDTIGILGGAFSDELEGVTLGDDPVAVHILNNIVMPPTLEAPHNNNIQIGDGTTGTIIGNEVSGALLESPDWSGSGIIVAGSSNVLISYNYVHNSEGGIQIIGYTEYRDAPAENNIIENNLVEGNEGGIVPQMYSIGTIIRYNDVLTNDEGIAVMAIDYSWEHSTPSGTEIHSNNIVGNVNYGVKSGLWGSNTGNVLAEEVDATNNWWGSASGPTHASNTYTVPAGDAQGDVVVSDLVDFVPWLDALYDTGDSFAPVENTDTAEQFSSIQLAIDAPETVDTHTISVADGTYSATINNSILIGSGTDEAYCFVHIDKSINLIGESRDGVILDGSGLYNENRSAGIWVSVSNVTVKDLTIQNFYVSDLERYSYGLVSWEKFRNFNTADPHVLPLSYLTAENLKIVDCQASLYFMMTEHTKVKDCIVEGSKADGIWIAMGSSDATVQGNIVTNSADHGIWVGGCGWCPPVDCPNATIIDNTINGAREAGISFVNSDGAMISGNTITNAAAEHPSVGGWSVGALSLKDGCSNVEAFNNNIYNNDGSWGGHDGTGHGVGIDGTPSNINLYFNNIYGNTGDGCHNYSNVAINATKNWWGTTDGAAIATMISGEVDYSPWWGESYLTGTAPGIELVDHPWTWYTNDSIQDAIDAALADDTINVAAGTYVESLVIDKPLTLQGPNVGISPNNGLRVAEAVITGVSPLVKLTSKADVNPLTIEGFTFQVQEATAEPVGGNRNGSVILANGISDGWGNVTIRSNRFIENYGPAIGVWAKGPVNSAGWTITDNLIDGVRGYQRSGIYLDMNLDPCTLTGWEISNNTIRNTQYGGIMVDDAVDMVISGNIIEDVQKTGIQPSGVSENLTITGNVITRAMLARGPGAIRAGIRLYGVDPEDEYEGAGNLIGPVWVTNNIVTDSYIGFAIKDDHDITGKVVHVNGNSFTENSEAGLRHGGTGLLDATNNWWGNPHGPGAGAFDNYPIGDTVSENVDADPWHLKQIADLDFSNRTESSVDLYWTTTGAWDGDYFDVRYSTSAITTDNWSSARRVTGEPTPATTVNTQGMRVHKLSENTTYHFGLKLIDKGIGSSDISNIVIATTLTTADAPTDTILPSPIDDLEAALGTPSTKKVILRWTAKGDDGFDGIASRYIIKRSTSVITADNFDSATTVHNNLRCKSNGESESFTVKRLTANTKYYFAIKIQDEVPNISDISNVVDITTASLLTTITDISPATADNGALRILDITGTNFTSSGTTVVRLISDDNAFRLPNVTYVDATHLTAEVPIGAPTGTYEARIINNHGRSALSSATYIVKAATTPLPVVTNLIPQMAASDTAVNGVKIFGKNLADATGVSFGDTPATSFKVISDTKITANVTGLSAGEYDVKVTTDAGTNSISAVKFKVSAPVVVNTDTTEDTITSEVVELDTNEIPVQLTLTTDTSETATQDTDTDAEIEVVIPPRTRVTDSEDNDYTGNIHPPRVVKPDESELTDLADNAVVIEMGNPEKTIHFDPDFVATITITSDTEPVIWYYNKDTEAYELAGKTGTKDGIDYVPGGTKLHQEDNTYIMGLLLDHMSNYIAGVNPQITSAPATATAGSAFTITGTNFHPTAAKVYFGGTAGTIVPLSTTKIVVTFPTAGTYTLKVENPDELSDTTSITLTTPPPAAGVGGGGDGYEPPPPPGTTDVRGKVTSAGRFTRSVTATSEDELCTLTIPTGTIGLTEELERITEITILEMDEPPSPPEDAHIIGLSYDFSPDGATFDPAITLTWSYDLADIPEGVAEEDLVIAYYEAGEWVELEGCVVDAESKTITAPVEHFTTFAIVVSIPPPAPAAFSVTDLLLVKSLEIQPKEAVIIAASVANTGGTEGSYTVVLKINGVKEAEKRVTVAAGRSQSVSFSVSREDAGTYKIAVDGLSASFTVVGPAPVVAPAPVPPVPPAPAPPAPAPAPPAPAPPEVIPPTAPNWPVLGGIIVAVVVVGLLIYFLVVRRRAY